MTFHLHHCDNDDRPHNHFHRNLWSIFKEASPVGSLLLQALICNRSRLYFCCSIYNWTHLPLSSTRSPSQFYLPANQNFQTISNSNLNCTKQSPSELNNSSLITKHFWKENKSEMVPENMFLLALDDNTKNMIWPSGPWVMFQWPTMETKNFGDPFPPSWNLLGPSFTWATVRLGGRPRANHKVAPLPTFDGPCNRW